MAGKFVYRVHAVQWMFERGIDADDVEAAIRSGQSIEQYPEDRPYPSKLLLGWAGARPLHVVVALNELDGEAIVITAYEPAPSQWEDGFTRRRKNP